MVLFIEHASNRIRMANMTCSKYRQANDIAVYKLPPPDIVRAQDLTQTSTSHLAYTYILVPIYVCSIARPGRNYGNVEFSNHQTIFANRKCEVCK